MKKFLTTCILSLLALNIYAQGDEQNTVQTTTSKKEIVKTGYNFGPLPAIAFDADKGFQL